MIKSIQKAIHSEQTEVFRMELILNRNDLQSMYRDLPITDIDIDLFYIDIVLIRFADVVVFQDDVQYFVLKCRKYDIGKTIAIRGQYQADSLNGTKPFYTARQDKNGEEIIIQPKKNNVRALDV